MSDVPPTTVQAVAAAIFAIAIIHTFSGSLFDALARRFPRHEGILHLLGEVEVVFGFWALVLVICIFVLSGRHEATEYVESRNFTEPLFVFAIMVIAGSRPILRLSTLTVRAVAAFLPVPKQLATYFLALSLVPLFGSLIHRARSDDPGRPHAQGPDFSNDIANAPNPAGYSILKDKFRDGAISAHWLFLGALGPTLVAIVAFKWL